MKRFFYLLAASAIILTSCSKKKDIDPVTDQPPTTGSTLDKIRDSVYLYAQQTYYWNTQLPSYSAFKPRSFNGSSDIAGLDKEVNALSQYAKNPTTGLPYEYYKNDPGTAKYSFIDDGSVSSELGGVRGDFGFAPFWISENDLRIKYVYPGSPADQKGIKRGYQIVKLNDRTGSGISLTDANINYVINAYSYSNNISMTLQRPDKTTFDVAMSVATYNTNPVITYKVFDMGAGKKVGYMVFNSFTSLTNAKPKIDEAIASFITADINNLVIDLRYNGGGYIETSQYLSNIIAPASVSGTTMFAYYFNQTMVNHQATILQNQKFNYQGKIYSMFDYDYSPASWTETFSKTGVPTFNNLQNVFFIVTGSTASASELLINNLIPNTTVKLIGTTSYGKPVGFQAININKYELYIPQFETKNSAGKGGYYAGMQPGSQDYPGKEASDDVTKEFGDPTESLLSYALNYIKNGAFVSSTPQIQSLNNQKILSIDETQSEILKLDAKEFKGMILNRSRLK